MVDRLRGGGSLPSEAQILVSGVEVAAAYLVQVLKALHQVALDSGDWSKAALIPHWHWTDLRPRSCSLAII